MHAQSWALTILLSRQKHPDILTVSFCSTPPEAVQSQPRHVVTSFGCGGAIELHGSCHDLQSTACWFVDLSMVFQGGSRQAFFAEPVQPPRPAVLKTVKGAHHINPGRLFVHQRVCALARVECQPCIRLDSPSLSCCAPCWHEERYRQLQSHATLGSLWVEDSNPACTAAIPGWVQCEKSDAAKSEQRANNWLIDKGHEIDGRLRRYTCLPLMCLACHRDARLV